MTDANATTTPKRLRIAVLNRQFSPTGGGAERYSIALVEQLAARHDIHVFAQDIQHAWPGVTYHRIAMPLRRPRWINQLWFAVATWWVTRSGFDVVHSHENTWHGQVQTVHVLPIKHNLFDGRSGVAWALRWLKVITSPRLLVYLALERARYVPQPQRCVVLTSSSLQAVMVRSYPAAAPAMRVITPGVAAVAAPATVQEQRAARAYLSLPEAGNCVLMVGNDYRKKGLPTLLAALRHLPVDAYLAVVGNAAQIPAFADEVQALGLAQRVFFLGALSDINLAYRAASVLAHATLEDTFAMVVLEAMAQGLPVIVSAAPYCGIASLLVHEQQALIVSDPHDGPAWTQALQRLLSDAPLRQQLTAAGQRFAQQHLWLEIAQQQEALYWACAAGTDTG